MIIKKTGVHFTEDFFCVSRMPGMRQTAQNYSIECKISGKSFICLTLPTDRAAQNSFIDVENFVTLMRKLDHFALPRLVQENIVDNCLYLIMTSDNSGTKKKD